MQHKLSPLAVRDIASIFRQSVINFGLAHADRYLAGLDESFAQIARNPHASPARVELGGVRLKRYGSHHIFYLVGTEEVVVVRVLHGRQDMQRHLRP